MNRLAERERLENRLRHNVEFARAMYEDVHHEYTIHRELAAAAAKEATVDGNLLHRRCGELHDAMQLALDQYRSELDRFARLVIYRELPE